MSLVPFVSPANEEAGLATTTEIVIIYPVAIDEGCLDLTPPLLVKKIVDGTSNQIKPHQTTIKLERLNLLNDLPFTGSISDFSNNQYRSKITLKPTLPLEENSSYSVIIPKELTLLTVTDPIKTTSGLSPLIEIKGPYRGLSDEEFTINILEDGTQNRASYSIKKKTGQPQYYKARSKNTDIDNGINIRFPDGEYKAGDIFTFKGRPAQKINELFIWSFETGTHQSQLPEDKTSNKIINLPVSGGVGFSGGFHVIKITPDVGFSMYKGSTLSVEFSKPIDAASISKESIIATFENLLTGISSDLKLNYTINGNILIITFEE